MNGDRREWGSVCVWVRGGCIINKKLPAFRDSIDRTERERKKKFETEILSVRGATPPSVVCFCSVCFDCVWAFSKFPQHELVTDLWLEKICSWNEDKSTRRTKIFYTRVVQWPIVLWNRTASPPPTITMRRSKENRGSIQMIVAVMQYECQIARTLQVPITPPPPPRRCQQRQYPSSHCKWHCKKIMERRPRIMCSKVTTVCLYSHLVLI